MRAQTRVLNTLDADLFSASERAVATAAHARKLISEIRAEFDVGSPDA